MTIAVSNTVLTDTFGHWLARVNEIATAMSTKVVTADSNTTIGNVSIEGTFSANVISCDKITAPDGSTEILAANLIIDTTGGLVSLGIVNIKNDLIIDAVSKVQISGSNSTHTFLAANPSTGNLEFQRIEIPIDQLTDVDSTNAAKTNTSILMWNTSTGKWQSNTLSLIDSTRINTLNVGSVSSTLTVSGNATISNNTLYVNGTSKRVGIGISNPSAALHVSGAILATGDIQGFQTSDEYFKTNITEYRDEESLSTILKFEVASFEWNTSRVNRSKYVAPKKEGRDVGLIAQRVQQHNPEMVIMRDDGTLAVDYSASIPYLIGSIKALHKEIEELKNGK